MGTRIRHHIRSNLVAYVALFFAFTGGAAWATHPGGANTISSGDIINGEVENNDLGADSVGSGKIADRSVKNADLSIGASSSNTIADGGIQGVDVKNETLTGAQVDESTLFNDGSLTDADLKDGAVTPKKLGTLPAVRVRTTLPTAQTTRNVAVHSVQFAAEEFDTAGAFSPSQSQVCLVPPIGGTYVIEGDVTWEANATGYRALDIMRDHPAPQGGFSDKPLASVGGPALAPPAVTKQSITAIEQLAAGDCVRLRATQASGGELDVIWAHFSMAWVGPTPPVACRPQGCPEPG
jgi:hypothetical protein